MAYGDVVHDCSVVYREPQGLSSVVRQRKSVTVEHVGRNRILIHLPRAGRAVWKSLTAKRIEVVTSDGRDLVAEWREVPGRD